MTLYLGENLISGTQVVTDKSERIGQIIASTVPLTDSGLHLLDGSLISGSGSYSAFVDYVAGLVTDYPDLFETEANWQASVSTYGVCGKFVYDSVNNTVRLPKITGFVEGTTDVTALGDLVEAGLPNITGSAAAVNNYGILGATPDVSGCFTGGATTGGTLGGVSGAGKKLDFDASNSNSIYGNSSTVQPQAIKVLYYIVIANSTKTNIEVDIDEIATDLNGKADTDLSNITSYLSSNFFAKLMPDYDNGVSKTPITQYTAEKDGYLYLYSEGGDQSWVDNVLVIDGVTFQNKHHNAGYTSFYSNILFMPIKKGSVYTATCTTCTFYPLKGAN